MFRECLKLRPGSSISSDPEYSPKVNCWGNWVPEMTGEEFLKCVHVLLEITEARLTDVTAVDWAEVLFERDILKIMTQTLEELRWRAVEGIGTCEMLRKFIGRNNFARAAQLKKKQTPYTFCRKSQHVFLPRSFSGVLRGGNGNTRYSWDVLTHAAVGACRAAHLGKSSCPPSVLGVCLLLCFLFLLLLHFS